MNYFTIRDIENLSGIKAHTLRMWERRYQFLAAPRKESGHRYYTGEDLKQLLKVSALYHAGVRISDIDRMSPEEMKNLVYVKGKTNSYTPMINLLLESCIDLNEATFTEVLRHSINQLGFENAMQHVAYPLLQKIGNLWLTDHLRPIQEHFASSRVRHEMILKIDGLKIPADPAWNFLVFTPEGEQHEMPILLAAYMLRSRGISVTYAGAGAGTALLQEVTAKKNITHLFFHMTTNLTNSRFDDYIHSLCAAVKNIPIVCAGPAVELPNNPTGQVYVLKQIADLTEICSNPGALTLSQERMRSRRRA
jgi:MerR family transcriptional regulator, light-induced transcriptional regulator